MNKIALQAEKISFRYHENSPFILNHINLSLRKGEIIGIVGLSGSGKSTLISILNGIIPKRINGLIDGKVLINQEDIASKNLSELSTQIGTIFQDPDSQIVFSCVEDELAFSPENLCYDPIYIKNSIQNVVKTLGIEHLLYRNPNHLSGGEKQLIALASVLTLNAGIIILDETMSQIDEAGKKMIKNAVITLKNEGKAILMVEHDLNNLDIADQIILLTNGTLRKFEGIIE
ncbi:MAG: ABC transporter ATP-binding protein [Tissierellales bacterium]|nr:ABC transporter ATP-binding protein [Tissierellales bacterium]MBN2828256.1 ABC transporter ATP-binding protein [Tissierellales bacterium]